MAAFAIAGGVAAYLLLSGALSPRPVLRILAPLPNAVLKSGTVGVSVQVENAVIAPAGSSREGYHLHYYLDTPVPTTPRRPATTAKGTWTCSTAMSYAWWIASRGPHVLAVQLVTRDDYPLNPPVTAAVIIQVVETPPSPTKSPPAPIPGEGGC